MRTEFNLIRHGQTAWNREGKYQGSSDVPLDDTGRRQAEELGASMTGESWSRIVSSPSVRALETAQIVADAIGFERNAIVEDARLMERNYGAAEGLTMAERKGAYPGEEWEGLEAWDDVATRSMTVMEEAVRDHAGERTLIVSHGGAINAILATISDGEVGSGKTAIRNTSRTTVTNVDGTWEIGEISNIDHLSEEPI